MYSGQTSRKVRTNGENHIRYHSKLISSLYKTVIAYVGVPQAAMGEP